MKYFRNTKVAGLGKIFSSKNFQLHGILLTYIYTDPFTIPVVEQPRMLKNTKKTKIKNKVNIPGLSFSFSFSTSTFDAYRKK